MRKTFCLSAVLTVAFFQNAIAQNSSPYWSLAGNSNASTSSKLGTTTATPLNLYTNNTVRLFISPNAGYVGIGTTSPASRLHVNAASGTSPLKFQVNGSTKLYMSSGGGLSVGSGTAAPSNGLYVAGNTAIGTSTASGRLTVRGTGLSSTAVRITNGELNVGTEWSTGDEFTGMRIDAPTGIHINAMTGVESYGMTAVYANGYQGVYASGSSYGVSAYSEEGTAVDASSSTGYGVSGVSQSSYGGYFTSNSSWALRAETNTGTYAGVFYGRVYASGGFEPSDRNLKKNIQEFHNALDIVNKLQPRTYEYKTDGKYQFMHLPTGNHYGLIAQDLEPILPNLVATTNHEVLKPAQRTQPWKPGMAIEAVEKQKPEVISSKAVNYTELIPILVGAVQEVAAKTAEIDALKARIEKLEALLNKTTGATLTSASLGLVTPNPVRSSARISYNLPDGITRAQLVVTDALGKTVKTVSLQQSGTVELNTATLSSGLYHYALMADGKVVATQKMEVLR